MRALLLLFGLGLIAGCDRQETPPRQAEAGAPASPTAGQGGLDRSQAGKPAPDLVFKDEEGGEARLADFAGKPLLVNMWATWCAPCVKELPTLDALADRPGAPEVLALSQDMRPAGEVQKFLAERKLGLDAYQDADMAMSAALGVNILPTTILYGSDSREIWRYSGDLDWTGAQAAELLKEAR